MEEGNFQFVCSIYDECTDKSSIVQAFHPTDYSPTVRIVLFNPVQYCRSFPITALLSDKINVVINTNVTHCCSICDAQAVKQFFDYVQCTLRITHIDSVDFTFLEVGNLCYVLAHILIFANISESFRINLADAMALCDTYALCVAKLHILPCNEVSILIILCM